MQANPTVPMISVASPNACNASGCRMSCTFAAAALPPSCRCATPPTDSEAFAST
jgi:hypothetical protein